MKAIICGAGKYARHLLARLGERWHITLVDQVEEALNPLLKEYAVVERVVTGDASSPVLLEKAGLKDCDYVLALTNHDKVNLAVSGFARESGVPHVMAVLNDLDFASQYRELDVYTLSPGKTIAGIMYHYLQDPRISVFPLAKDQGEMVELEVTRDNWIAGMSVDILDEEGWRVAGLFREGKLVPPRAGTTIREGDRLILLGQRDFFRSVCSLLACANLPFPLSWGGGLLAVMNGEGEESARATLRESMYFVPNTRITHVSVLRPTDAPEPSEYLDQWRDRYDIQVHETAGNPVSEIGPICKKENIGLVILRPLEKSFLKSLTRPEMIALAHSLPCPMLVARHTTPYERILVPFSGTPRSERALETAFDLAEQFDALIDAAVVEEPEFIHGEDREEAIRGIFRRVREMSHIHKVKVGEIRREGNPVRELTRLAADYDLMVVGSTRKEKELLAPHIGELLTEKAPCSVLIVASE
jgi:Trk K+ transport system NAD-binding subunit/nucleotide-binding universal stress UspA family protein